MFFLMIKVFNEYNIWLMFSLQRSHIYHDTQSTWFIVNDEQYLPASLNDNEVALLMTSNTNYICFARQFALLVFSDFTVITKI